MKALLALLLVVAASGCATVTIPRRPDVTVLSHDHAESVAGGATMVAFGAPLMISGSLSVVGATGFLFYAQYRVSQGAFADEVNGIFLECAGVAALGAAQLAVGIPLFVFGIQGIEDGLEGVDRIPAVNAEHL